MIRYKAGLGALALMLAAWPAHAEQTFEVPAGVSEGHLNIRSGPGVNFPIIGAIPAATSLTWRDKPYCVARQDGMRGADWCLVNHGGVQGWASKAGLVPIARLPAALPPAGEDSVPIYPGHGYNAALVDVTLGGQTVRMLIDTGADSMSVSQSVAAALVATGEAEWGRTMTVRLADGSTVQQSTVSIRRVWLGRHLLTDVQAGVVADGGMMLLPFTVLSTIGKFAIDTHQRKLSFN
jgi:clan AA aspartic protease (TIGR02281 family)